MLIEECDTLQEIEECVEDGNFSHQDVIDMAYELLQIRLAIMGGRN
jgi:hypothetical protein